MQAEDLSIKEPGIKAYIKENLKSTTKLTVSTSATESLGLQSHVPRHYSIRLTPSSTHSEQGYSCKTLREMSEAVMDMRGYKHKQRKMPISVYRWDN